MYPNFPNYRGLRNQEFYDDRFGGFAIPFLLGGLGGAAVVGLSRPRPVYVNPAPYPNQPYPYYPPYYNYPY